MDKEITLKLRNLFRRSSTSIISFWLFITELIGVFILKYALGINEQKMCPLMILLLVTLIYGMYIQFSLKCPYCGFHFAFLTGLGLPYSCMKCKRKIKDSFFADWPFTNKHFKDDGKEVDPCRRIGRASKYSLTSRT